MARVSAPFRLPTLDEARALGRTLRAVDPRLLKGGVDGGLRWWNGTEPYLEASVEQRDDVVVAVDVSVRGHVLRFTTASGVRTGRTDEHLVGGAAPQSRLVSQDAVARADVVAVVVTLLSSSSDPILVAAARLLVA